MTLKSVSIETTVGFSYCPYTTKIPFKKIILLIAVIFKNSAVKFLSSFRDLVSNMKIYFSVLKANLRFYLSRTLLLTKATFLMLFDYKLYLFCATTLSKSLSHFKTLPLDPTVMYYPDPCISFIPKIVPLWFFLAL